MKQVFAVLLTLLTASTFAQVADKPEDIAPLLIGETLPDAKLLTVDDKEVSFASLLDGKKTIVIFYRGSWCPYCNLHLAAVGQVEDSLIALGYQVIAVSPDTPEYLNKMIDKHDLKYTLLSDSKGDLLRAVGVAFYASGYHFKDLQDIQQTDKPILPVPSLFIADGDRNIQFEYVCPNFKQRISTDLLLSVAKTLAGVK